MGRFALVVVVAVACVVHAFRYTNVTHSLQEPLKKLHPDLRGTPFPTQAFWANFVLGQGVDVVVSYPYTVSIQKNQLHISYPFRVVTSRSIIEGFTSEIIVELGTQPLQVRRFDELSVTVEFPQASGGVIALHLVRGSPYITLVFHGAAPTISSSINIVSLTPASNYTQATLGNWHQWLLFTSSPFTWTQQGKKWSGPSNFDGVLRIALALHENTKPILAAHASVYPVGASIAFKPTNETNADVTFSWQTRSFNSTSPASLLMAALHHHIDTFSANQAFAPEIQFMCMRGPMKGVLGDVWTFHEPLTDVPWDYPIDGVFKSPTSPEYNTTVEFIHTSLDKDIDRFPAFAEDSYNFGKQFGREARLVLTAHRFNSTTAFTKGLTKLQNQIAKWLTGNNTNHFVYDTSYGGLITLHGYQSEGEDFGNGMYNDHHFHYGYFIYGLSVIRRFNESFIHEHQEAIQYILSDIGSPLGISSSFFSTFPQRKLFPTARHKDWYCGHSYASGLFTQANGRSQESTSESVNAYYALALFASLDSSPEYFNYARLLLATELRSSKTYWHISSSQSPTIYEPAFAGNKIVGVLSEIDAVYSTWFGDLPAFIHGIQTIPVTPITAYLLPASYVAEERAVLDGLPVISNPSDIWSSVLSLNNAIVHAKAEWTKVQTTNYNYDTWSSAANAMHWIASRPSFIVEVPPAVTSPPPVCFGYPACALAGAFGSSLDCCKTLPGCCPGDNPCCNSDISPVNASNVCHDEPACGVLGLSCCDSPEGCCKPTPTGQVLGCCKQTTKPTAAPSLDTAQCHHQPKCAAAGLECCQSPEGCCVPTPTGQVLGCCESPNATTTAPPATSTCHNEPQCGLLGLYCCGTPEGCCNTPPGQPKLDCCSVAPAPKAHSVTVGDSGVSTCQANPRCLTAGPNGDALPCCKDAVGCCPGNACCGSNPWNVERILLIILGTLGLAGLVYCSVLYLRRKNYQPLEGDIRAWYCAGFALLTFGVFFYLVFTVKN
ncbi:hypothetical protein LEN26_018109 [Aphanomyces euteiches]|nr:hypothetical protein LEN26_018109 [Aphanomyces euteiches]KAH9185217.1 hypothetical protein AeNC1_012806 [Aphanomyces euteiches]